MKTKSIPILIGSICGIILCSNMVTTRIAKAEDTGIRVGGSSLRFNGEIIKNHEYSGPCPVDLKFSWGVIGSSTPTTISYTFTRSDNASTKTFTKTLPVANKSVPVYENWRLGANNGKFTDFKGWAALKIDGPSALEYKIPFTLHCQ